MLVNDLSFHGQFSSIAQFREPIGRIMAIRNIARRFGRNLRCRRGIGDAAITTDLILRQAVQVMTDNERRALMQWLTQTGPFWDDVRHHQPDDWFECNGDIVTDTAVAEAAWCGLNGMERWLVSLTPSAWGVSPVQVDWVQTANGNRTAIDLTNHWSPDVVEAALQVLPAPLESWGQLGQLALARCDRLVFSQDAFVALNGQPFASSAAHRLLFILNTLNRLKSCFNAVGERTAEGHRIYQDFFTGVKGDGGRGALFSDSSDDEKRLFKDELTFKHPADPNETLFCTWHGKVQTPQMRVHFSAPIRSDEPTYVVYVGPKLTKR